MGDSSLSGLVAEARSGDAKASAALIDTVYPELRRLAHHYLAGERPEHTLQTSDLVHEAWLRLFSSEEISVNDRAHLVALMATQMRRAPWTMRGTATRRRDQAPASAFRSQAQTRSEPSRRGRARPRSGAAGTGAVDPRAVRVVEMRFFGGLAETEAAQALGVSVATLKRDWTFARAWLTDRLTTGA